MMVAHSYTGKGECSGVKAERVVTSGAQAIRKLSASPASSSQASSRVRYISGNQGQCCCWQLVGKNRGGGRLASNSGKLRSPRGEVSEMGSEDCKNSWPLMTLCKLRR